MRSATLLPVPGTPVMSAKPPSRTWVFSMRQAKSSIAAVASSASVGSSGEKGFHFRP